MENGRALQYASKDLREHRRIVEAAVRSNVRSLDFISDLIFTSQEEGIPPIVLDALKNNHKGNAILHTWVDDPEKKDILKCLVEQDPGMADIKHWDGKRAIDRAHPSCREAMESILSLFGLFHDIDPGPCLHMSHTTCVFKAFSRDGSHRKEIQSFDGLTPKALKCMNLLRIALIWL